MSALNSCAKWPIRECREVIPKETVDQIVDAAKIEEVVGDFVSLKRKGGSFWACCPFHNEKSPSFHVVPARGIYKCFGCGKAGNAIGFLMDYERLSYTEALKYLADKYHIEVREKEETAEEIAARQKDESLHLVSDFALKFFCEQLSSGEGRAIGYQYFRSRGLLDQTIEEYGLGWAPSGKNAFTEAALKEGYKKEYLVETGLSSEWEDGSVHDRFYERVIFPIHSVSGRVIAFGGRTLKSGDEAKKIGKYVNSKESEIYIKNKALYAIHKAKNEINKQDKAILVEGYLDVLSMHQLGVRNVVASCGTSLTEEQVKLIKRFTDNVTVIYDGDSAGIHATLRAINLILKEGMNVKAVLLPDGEDPDSYAQTHTLEEVKAYIASHEVDFVEFKAQQQLDPIGDDPLQRANLINDVADTIALIPDGVKRAVYVEATARRFRVDEDLLFERIGRTREKLVFEQQRDRRREEREEENEPARRPSATAVARKKDPLVNDELLAPSEEELLTFILTDGTESLSFEVDSEFYDPEGSQSVAEFIDTALSGDGIVFSNDAYRRTYDAYFALYDKGLAQDQIVRELMSGEDREVADVTARCSVPKYELTVKNFTSALTAKESWLVIYVPRAILAYHVKRLQQRQETLTRELSGAGIGRQLEIMAELGKLNSLMKRINVKLGRIRKE